MNESTIDVEAAPSQAVAVRQEGGALGRALTIDELHRNLEYVREVMRKEMKKGTDYGQIPGCGDKPGLFQPGAQKLLLTFNLCEYVKKEVLREYPGFHREYEFTVTVKAPNGKEWDGIGTCSTLEAKYRYRKGERKCPKCGHASIIPENPKFLKAGQIAGWLCWAKKNGCGAKFAQKEPAIVSQTADKTENPDPAECWNTVRKMAFKRALVAAAINATNTSELWTQDLEDMRPNGSSEADDSPPPSDTTPPVKTPPRPASAHREAQKPPSTAKIPFPTAESRSKMITALNAQPGQPDRETVDGYFRHLENPCPLMPNEGLEDLPLRFVPATTVQMRDLIEKIKQFGAGIPAAPAFPPHPEPETAPKADPKGRGGQNPPYSAPTASETSNRTPSPTPTGTTSAKPKDDEWWRDVIVPVPHKGQKRAEYEAHPETIGQLFDMRHGQDEESQAARQRLWGFINHYEAKGWTKRDGTKMPPSAHDLKFREALDALAEWHKRNCPGEKL